MFTFNFQLSNVASPVWNGAAVGGTPTLGSQGGISQLQGEGGIYF